MMQQRAVQRRSEREECDGGPATLRTSAPAQSDSYTARNRSAVSVNIGLFVINSLTGGGWVLLPLIG